MCAKPKDVNKKLIESVRHWKQMQEGDYAYLIGICVSEFQFKTPHKQFEAQKHL